MGLHDNQTSDSWVYMTIKLVTHGSKRQSN